MCDVSIYKGPTPYHNLLAALNQLPEKSLSTGMLFDGELPCALGALLTPEERTVYRDMNTLIENSTYNGSADSVDDFYKVAYQRLNQNVAPYLQIKDVVYETNDSHSRITESPSERFERMVKWAQEHIAVYEQDVKWTSQ